jgi:PAS domain S-box-containing protein
MFVLARPASAADPPPGKNVLILYSFSDRGVVEPADSLESALRARVPWPVNFYVEYMETQRFDNPTYEKSLVETLQNTYGGEKLDLVIVVSYPALEFVLRHRDELFPGVRIVFSDVDVRRIAGQKTRSGVTGVTSREDVGGTIDLALHLHPNTNAVAIITNNSEFERFWLAAVHAELLRHQSTVREIDLVGLPTSQLLEKVAGLPPQTVVLFQVSPQDSIQPTIGVFDTLALIGQRLPTYCIFPILCLNHGGIGGADIDVKEQTALAAELARRVLSGEQPENIPVVHGSADQVRVDWRQLRRWNIPESALPPGSLVLYREPSLWERDRKYIIAAAVIIVAQLFWIAALLWQRARKRKAEAVLRESEQRFRVMADTTPSLIWMADQNGKVTYLNSKSVEFTGDPKAGFGDSWSEYVHPDDLDGVLSANAGALANRVSFSKKYRLRRHDGVYRWMFDVASPRVNGDGSFAGFIGSAIDITDQKVAQEALENVSGRLIEAQEKERSRIARDLHDDVCQRLALLSMELEQANRSLNGPSAGSTNERLEKIQRHCSEIAGDVQALSHQLHSSKLDYLGVAAAIRGFCKEFAKLHNVTVEFTDHNVPKHLPKDVSLCLFRVAQEGLHNALKYSKTSQFDVQLTCAANEVQLQVRDEGAGFEVEEARVNGGLGLVSMKERVHLVGGRFSVESKPGNGTRIVATVPVVAESAVTSKDAQADESASVTGAA